MDEYLVVNSKIGLTGSSFPLCLTWHEGRPDTKQFLSEKRIVFIVQRTNEMTYTILNSEELQLATYALFDQLQSTGYKNLTQLTLCPELPFKGQKVDFDQIKILGCYRQKESAEIMVKACLESDKCYCPCLVM